MLLSVLETELANIPLVAIATFVAYTNKVRMSVRMLAVPAKNQPGEYQTGFFSTAALVSLVSVEGQNPSQLFATVEISEAIEDVKSSMFMLIFSKWLKTC